MAKGTLNKVILIGNVGKDVKYIESGEGVAKLSLATTEVGRDKIEKTDWHNITAFGKLAGIARDYVTKGAKVYVEGRLQINKWTDKEGREHVSPDIIASSLQILNSKKTSDMPPLGTVLNPAVAPLGFEDIPF
jgi:single-strand DNA-binding protein